VINKTRITVSLALLFYTSSIFFLVLSPRHSITWGSWFCVGLATISSIGLIANMFPQITLPGEKYAYLVTGYTGFTALLIYLIDTSDSSARRLGVTLVLLTGIIGGYGAFLGQTEGW